MELRISGLVNDSIVDGPGFRFVVYVQGCPHHCEGCHNHQTHDFEGGTTTTTEEIMVKIKRNPLLKGITLSGGEPFCQCAPLAELARMVKKQGLSVMAYSGYTIEQLLQRAKTEESVRALLLNCDILVDGPFIKEQRDISLRFRGSKNQRIIDPVASLKKGVAVEREF